MRAFVAAVAVLFATVLAGCGQKGPLVMPDAQPHKKPFSLKAHPPAAPATQPAPAGEPAAPAPPQPASAPPEPAPPEPAAPASAAPASAAPASAAQPAASDGATRP